MSELIRPRAKNIICKKVVELRVLDNNFKQVFLKNSQACSTILLGSLVGSKKPSVRHPKHARVVAQWRHHRRIGIVVSFLNLVFSIGGGFGSLSVAGSTATTPMHWELLPPDDCNESEFYFPQMGVWLVHQATTGNRLPPKVKFQAQGIMSRALQQSYSCTWDSGLSKERREPSWGCIQIQTFFHSWV